LALATRSLGAAVILIAGTAAANAKCTRLAFSVNDYGKEGPTKDAKALLDKYIASWTAERGIKNYKTGKKDVKCELFLDFGVFDEHTCKASATVCWTPGTASPAKGKSAPAPKSSLISPAPAAPAASPSDGPAAPAPARIKSSAT
jgi:hypothetical protein